MAHIKVLAGAGAWCREYPLCSSRSSSVSQGYARSDDPERRRHQSSSSAKASIFQIGMLGLAFYHPLQLEIESKFLHDGRVLATSSCTLAPGW